MDAYPPSFPTAFYTALPPTRHHAEMPRQAWHTRRDHPLSPSPGSTPKFNPQIRTGEDAGDVIERGRLGRSATTDKKRVLFLRGRATLF